MSHLAIPTMAQAMANKVGTTTHARQPLTEAAAGGLFETLLTAAGDGETGNGEGISGPSDADTRGIWKILLSRYMATGLGRREAAQSDMPAGLSQPPSGTGSWNSVPFPGEGPAMISGSRPPDGVHVRTESVLGSLSAAFESGAAGADAIGYDPGGGTSYGVYQIASKPGTMDRFIDFLAGEAPAWAERLRAAGDANTGGTGGGMPRVWKAIASEDPARFNGLQHAFIEATHYRPAERKIAENQWIRPADRSEALREVLWSTAVQHGPDGAARIFQSALDRLRSGGDEPSDAAIIEQVYALRAETADSHAPELASALRNRFRSEKRQSLDLLANIGSGETAIL